MNAILESKFYEVLMKFLTDKRGKISAAKLKESTVRRNGLGYEWDWFMSATNYMPESLTPYQRLRFLQDGAYPEFPSCYCGKPCSFLNNKPSKYCSKACALSSPEKSRKLKDWYKSADKGSMNEKRKKTMVEKYGYAFNAQRPEVKEGFRSQIKVLTKSDYIDEKRSNDELATWIESLGVKVIRNDRKVLYGSEIDIFLPEYSLGIELNGLYFHSEIFKHRTYHLDKWNLAKEKGIDLLFFNSEQYDEKLDMIRSMIMSSFKMNHTIHARKCAVIEVDAVTAKEFLDENHIQGSCGSRTRLGLTTEGHLIALMTFGKPRFDKGSDWEIIRSCTRKGFTVVGGVSRLVTAFRRMHPTDSIISYVDAMHGTGRSLLGSGFKLVGHSSPGYVWTDGTKTISRYKTMRSKLSSWLDGYDPEKSERENLQSNGFSRYWDCGQMKFKFELE